MARAKTKTITGFVKTADEALFKLHDKFSDAYCEVLFLRGGSDLSTASKKEKGIHRRWERAVNVAVDRARAVARAPAYTLEGMLMKIHVAGFAIGEYAKDSFSAPYHGMICSSGKPQEWQPRDPDDDAGALLVSLRADLQRFAGRRT